MTTRQEQLPDQRDTQEKQHRRVSRKLLIILAVFALAVAICIIWILSYLNIIPRFLAPIFTIIVTVLGLVFAFLQSMHLFIPIEEHKSRGNLPQTSMPSLDKTTYRGIIGLPPLTDPGTIQQREQVVREVYTMLVQPDITAIALTGIGGVGKSTLAALIYRSVEEQRGTHNSPFLADTLWLTIDPAVTFAELAGNLSESLGKPLPDLNKLAPQSQARAVFNAMNATGKPHLIILDQFENLLDWETGHALTDRPGVGEWLDILNSQPCSCRILLTSRPRPIGTREYLPTYLREYPVGGLTPDEGAALLRKQGVQGTSEELQTAVSYCAGHAFSLILLALLLRDHHLDLTTLFKQTSLWVGDIASNLLDQIYQQRLNDVQRKLLLAFSVYREPVLLEAAEAVLMDGSESQITHALKTLWVQHLIEPAGEGRYQLHAIVAKYAHGHFDESSQLANKKARRETHVRAAEYYQQKVVSSCPPPDRRISVNDIHDLIEAVWQYCQAEQWQEAYNLIKRENIFSSLKRWGNFAILLELCLLLHSSSSWSPEPAQLAVIHRQMAWAYNALGKREWAREHNEKALQLYTESGDLEGQENILASLGWSCYASGSMKQAREYYERALGISREMGNRPSEGHDLNGLGRIYDVQGRRKQALKYFEQALAICKEVENPQLEGRTLSNLGLIHTDLGHYAKALEYLEQSLVIRKNIGDRRGVGVAHELLGRVYRELGQYESAVKYTEEALNIYQTIGERGLEGWALHNLGWIYNASGQYEQARQFLERALPIRQEVGDHRGENRTLRDLGKSFSGLGQKERAMEYYKRALIISQEIQDPYGEGTILQNAAKIYFEQGRYDVALACFLIAKRIFDEIDSPYSNDARKWIDALHKKIGEEQFMASLAKVEPQARQIAVQELLSH